MTRVEFESRAETIGTALLVAALALAYVFEVGRAFAWGADSWGISEWLISYAGGFVRRGLGGEAIRLLAYATGVRANVVVICLSAIVYPLVLGWFAHALRGRFPRPILISSLVFGMPAFSAFLIRKDVLEIGLFVIMLLLLRPGRHPRLRIAAFWLVSVAAVLIHETIAFVALPSAVAIAYRSATGSTARRCGIAALLILPAAAALLAAVVFHGDRATSAAIVAQWGSLWHDMGPGSCAGHGPPAISAIGWDPARAQKAQIRMLGRFSHGIYVPAAWLATFALVGATLVFAERPPREDDGADRAANGALSDVLVWLVPCVLPLVLVGEDFGRWIFLWAAGALAVFATGHAACFPSVGLWRWRGLRRGYAALAPIRWAVPFGLLFVAVPSTRWSVETYAGKTPARYLAQLASAAVGRHRFFETAPRFARDRGPGKPATVGTGSGCGWWDQLPQDRKPL